MAETWRDYLAPRVDQAITEGKAKGLEGKKLLRYIQSDSPFGPANGLHPHKVWLSECRRQLKMKTPAEQKAIDAKPTPLFDEGGEDGRPVPLL